MLMAGLRATACHVGVPDREGKEGGGGGVDGRLGCQPTFDIFSGVFLG